MTMGEGGAVYTNDPLLHKLVNSFRDWGRDCWCVGGVDNTCKYRFSKQFGELPLGYDHKYVYSHSDISESNRYASSDRLCAVG